MNDQKMFTLKLDSADMALIVGGLAMQGCMPVENAEVVRATFDEVKSQLASQGLDAMAEIKRQQDLYVKRRNKR